MSSNSTEKVEEKEEVSFSIVEYRFIQETPCCHFDYITPTSAKIQELGTTLNTEYRREHDALGELNTKFRYMIDSAHQLEVENAKYMNKVFELRRQAFLMSIYSKQAVELEHTRADVVRVNYDKLIYDSEAEYFQMEADIYKQVVPFEQGSMVKLEQELKESSTTLQELRRSYHALEQRVEIERTLCRNTMQEYKTLAKELTLLKKQIKESKFSMELVKYQTQFSQTLYSRGNFFSIDMSDWTVGWEQVVKKIRHDLGILYAAIHQGTLTYYEKKTQEIQSELDQAEKCRIKVRGKREQALLVAQQEYEEVQKSYTYEHKIQVEVEAKYSQLEADLRSIQMKQKEEFSAQSEQLNTLHENIMAMVISIEEMQRKRVSLENEIIIYRHILGESEMKRTIEATVKKRKTYMEKIESLGFVTLECPLDGKYIAITNTSTNGLMDISGWSLIRRVDDNLTLRYRLPDHFQVGAGVAYRFYPKQEDGEVNDPSFSYEKIIMDETFSMGIGEKIETELHDENNQQIVKCIQTATSGWI